MITVCVPHEPDREVLLSLFDGIEVLVWDGTGDVPSGVERTQFLVAPYMGSPFSPAALARLPELEIIQLLSAGVEPWLDRIPPGVVLCNGRGVHGGSTAELAVLGVLTLLRGLPRYLDQQANGVWAEHQSADLDGLPVLLLGAGDIGQRVAASLSALGAKCTFVGRSARADVHAIDELTLLIPQHRVVVLALPHTAETHHLVDAAFLAALPDGALVVNVARGNIVDGDALLAELETGRISAFLDVTEPEPLPADHPLWRLPNVVITPHVGGGTAGWHQRGMRLVADQLGRHAAGDPLINVITGTY